MTDEIQDRKARDNKRLKKVAQRHAAIVLGALTLWGTADAWAISSGWTLAEIIALLNAVFAGLIVAYISHEWGHFAGARLQGAVSPVLKEPFSFFMFDFKYDFNTQGQFLSMSMGGPAANWLLFLALFVMIPMATWPQALLVAVTFGVAVSVSVFEFPIMQKVMYGEDPRETIAARQKAVGNLPRNAGFIAGLIFWLIAI